MNTKLLHRLAWKELRTLRALWLTLFITAVVLQLGLVWVFDTQHAVANGVTYHPRAMWLIGVLAALPAIFAVASLSMSFAGEREEGTDQFLCRLAAPPLTLLGVKVGLCVASTVAMFALLVIPTNVLDFLVVPRDLYPLMVDPLNPQATQTTVARLAKSHPELTVIFVDIRQNSRRVLEICSWILNILSCGVFFSLLFQRVFSSLIATALAAWLLPRTVVVLLTFNFGTFGAAVSWLEWLIHLGVIPGTLLLASVWLVQTWDEDRWPRIVERFLDAWRRAAAREGRPAKSACVPQQLSGGWRAVVRPFGLCWPDEWLPAWRRETRRLLWLEWRQARRVMLFVMAAFGVYVAGQQLFVAWGSALIAKEFPFVMALVSFVFGAWSFQAQQSGQRFRDFAGHGTSPVALWAIKQGVWSAVMLLTVVVLTGATASVSFGATWRGTESLLQKLAYGFSWVQPSEWNKSPQLMRESLGGVVPGSILAVGLCFAVGQLVSLLMTRAVTVATVGFVLTGLAFGWQQFSVQLAIPSWLAVLPLIIGLLLASAARMTDWLEERNSIRGWLRVIAACAVPSLVTLIGVPIYRVVEIPLVATVEVKWQKMPISALESLAANVSPDAKQTAQRWTRLAESLEGRPMFSHSVSVFPNAATGVVEQVHLTTPDPWDSHRDFVAWEFLTNRDWLAANAHRVSEAARISRETDCAFDSELFAGWRRRWDIPCKQLNLLALLLRMAAESALAEGKLDESLGHFLVLLRFSEHIQQHAQWEAVDFAEHLEIHVWDHLQRWARHPAQTGDSLRAALGRTANSEPQPLLDALKSHVELLAAPPQVVVEEYAPAKRDLAQSWRETKWPVSWMVWEQKREERLLDFSTSIALEDRNGWLRYWHERWQGDWAQFNEAYQWNPPESQKHFRADFLKSTTRSASQSSSHRVIESRGLDWQSARQRGEAATLRRGLIATIATRAFQLDHGRWPTQWDELVGPYLDSVPVEPWRGLPFEFRPEGYLFKVWIRDRPIPPHTPLLTLRPGLFPAVVHHQVEGKDSTSTEWFWGPLWGDRVWPSPEFDRPVKLIAFPLNATDREAEDRSEPVRK